MLRVAEAMVPDPFRVGPWTSVREAARLMAQRRVGSLVVVEDGQVLGVVTSRDLRGAHPNRLVVDVLKGSPVTIPPEASLLEAKALMEARGLERLLVVREGKLLGILTKSALAFALGQHFDPLTGLPQADLLRHHLESLLAQGKDPTLLFVDLDDFGRLNKENGHPFGDRVLKTLGQRLKGFAQDLGGEAYRYGGDEFALVFPHPRQVLLPALPSLLRPLEVEGKRVGFSVGVAGERRRQGRVPANPSATADDLLKLASLASTHAKRQGSGWAPAEALKAEEGAPEGVSSPKEPQSAGKGNPRAARGGGGRRSGGRGSGPSGP